MNEERAKSLFRKYVKERNGSFYSSEEIERMEGRCFAIAEELSSINFKIIIIGEPPNLLYEQDENGAYKVYVLHQKFVLAAFPPEGKNGSVRQVDYAEASTKLYVRTRPQPPEMVEDLLGSLSGEGAVEYAYRHCQNREWEFTYKERHAFQHALSNYWQEVERFLVQQSVSPPQFEWFSLLLSHVWKIAPTGKDIMIFDFLFEKEKAYLEERGSEFILDCGCSAGEHLKELKNWYRRNREVFN